MFGISTPEASATGPEAAASTSKKADLMLAKTNRARHHFGLPAEEDVVQDYRCVVKRKIPHPGHIYITQRYIGFVTMTLTEKIFLRFDDIQDISFESYFLGNGINISTKDGNQHVFAGFARTQESYFLLHYLWKFTPQDTNKSDSARRALGSLKAMSDATDMVHAADRLAGESQSSFGENPEFDVLLKNKDGSLVQSVFRCCNKCLMIIEKYKETQSLVYNWNDIDSVVMRSRPLHVDIKFKGSENLKLVSVFLQDITKQILLRNRRSQVVVEFEPNSTKFEVPRRSQEEGKSQSQSSYSLND
eukprot:TRINITY_DN11275_c0_g1_i1.p1 TRINITY_DN11275_c0_g1~~TRINITY_DN11275_c0_g1_i1.p1  ORF type:complete len:303 (+),score=94.91 TRINITY_DN11275_c0_g1_i1:44-952(+)